MIRRTRGVLVVHPWAGPRMPFLVTTLYPQFMMTISSSIAGLLVLGIVFHLVYIGTVFDCYFASPVVHGMRQYKLPRAQAKRLVLIVGARTRPLRWLFEGPPNVLSCIFQVMVCAPTLLLLQMLRKSCRGRRSASRPI